MGLYGGAEVGSQTFLIDQPHTPGRVNPVQKCPGTQRKRLVRPQSPSSRGGEVRDHLFVPGIESLLPVRSQANTVEKTPMLRLEL
jgi:hypothetical protein